MPREVSATEAKNRLGGLLGWVTEENDEVIITHQGKPQAVIMSFAAYEEVQAERRRTRRQHALDTILCLREELSARNRDMTLKQVEEFADRASREAVESLIKQGKVQFES